MKSTIRKYVVLILTAGLFLSCSKKTITIPADVFSKKQMVEVMTDVHLAEAAKDISMPGDKTSHSMEEYYAFVFNKHHITKDQFQKSLNFYKANPELMEEVYGEVINRLNEIQAKPENH